MTKELLTKELLTKAELAKATKFSERTIEGWHAKGCPNYRGPGGHPRYLLKEVLEWLGGHRVIPELDRKAIVAFLDTHKYDFRVFAIDNDFDVETIMEGLR